MKHDYLSTKNGFTTDRWVVALILLSMTMLLLPAHGSSNEVEIRSNRFGMEFVYIPTGRFRMGSTDFDRDQALEEMLQQTMKRHDANNYKDEQPAHTVEITRPFLLGRTEVTQSQWLRIMENRPGPAEYWQRDDWRTLPVVSISWNMAQLFTEELSRMDPDYDYRLPTEAEWEYAARAGSTGLRPFASDLLNERAWYFDSSGDEPHPVAGLPPNAFGLFDMLGNAWEWVADRYAPDVYGKGSARVDPSGPQTGNIRIRRGGSYHCPAVETRSAFREANLPTTRYTVTGFRVVAIPVIIQSQ